MPFLPPPRSWLLVLAVVCLMWAWSRPTTAASVTDTFTLVERINADRAQHGLSPLVAEARLSQAAQAHAEDMAGHDFVSHTGSDGRGYWQRATSAGYQGQMIGEVITAGQATAEEAFGAWLNSSPHHTILLTPELTQLGVGHAERQGSRYGNYWVVVVARPASGYVPTLVPTPVPLVIQVPQASATPTPTPFPPEIVRRLVPRQFLPLIERRYDERP